MTEKVIPHRKPKKDPKALKVSKPRRYAVEYFSYSVDKWIVKDDFHFAPSAKRWARYWEDNLGDVFHWRVVDRGRRNA